MPTDNTPSSSASDGGPAPLPSTSAVDAALARRRVLLKGLGKGGAVLAAMSPLASNATRSYTLFNPELGKNGYCSISGFQSAAISSAPDGGFVSCSSLKPSDYFTTRLQGYSDATDGQTNTRRRRGIQTMMFTSFGLNVSNSDANTLRFTGGVVNIGRRVFLAQTPTSSGGNIRVFAENLSNFPTGVLSITPTTAFSAVMASGSIIDPLLYTLFLNANNAYFAAVFLSCIREDGSIVSSSGYTAGRIPFDAQYVRTQYANNPVAAASFFRRLCGA